MYNYNNNTNNCNDNEDNEKKKEKKNTKRHESVSKLTLLVGNHSSHVLLCKQPGFSLFVLRLPRCVRAPLPPK